MTYLQHPRSTEQQASSAGQAMISGISNEQAVALAQYVLRTQNIASTNAINPAALPFHNKPLTIKDTAHFFQVSIQTVHNWRKSGFIRGYKVGRRTYYLLEELQAAINKKKAA